MEILCEKTAKVLKSFNLLALGELDMEWPISETIAAKFLSFHTMVKYEWLLQNRWLPLSKEHLFSAVLFGSPLSSVVCMCVLHFSSCLTFFGNYCPALVVGMDQLVLVFTHLAKLLNQ